MSIDYSGSVTIAHNPFFFERTPMTTENKPPDPFTTTPHPPPLSGSPTGLGYGLNEAMHLCQTLAKDKRNEYHRYDYVSSENRIREAREALRQALLALVPLSQKIVSVGERFVLEREFMLLHAPSGEHLRLQTSWPILPDKGRPLDKAVATADTASLGYLLRSLLLIPAVDPGTDMSAREDREDADRKPALATPTTSATAVRTGTVTSEQVDKLDEYGRELGWRPQQWADVLGKRGLKQVGDLSTEQAAELIAKMGAKITTRQLADAMYASANGPSKGGSSDGAA
jgi:hypothetical protein